MNECYHCGFNDEDYGCTCSHSDKWYACPIETKKENIQALIQEPCDDAISRKAVLDLAEWFYINQQHFIVANLIDEVENMPSVTPQQRTGRWERMSDLPNDVDDRFECSRCGNVVHHRSVMDLRTFSRWCGRCGSYNDYKKEVEE